MTGKERDILSRVLDEVGEMKGDVKTLLNFQSTYTEHAKGCDDKFKLLEKAGMERGVKIESLSKWRWTTTGALSLLAFLLGILVKVKW